MAFAGVLAVVLGAWGRGAVGAEEDAARPEYFTTRVRPVFEANCSRCHRGMNHRGGLSMQTRAAMLKGGHHGPALVPGDPAGSLLVKLMRHQGSGRDAMPMPPGSRARVSDADIAVVERWVKAGAVMPVEQPKP